MDAQQIERYLQLVADELKEMQVTTPIKLLLVGGGYMLTQVKGRRQKETQPGEVYPDCALCWNGWNGVSVGSGIEAKCRLNTNEVNKKVIHYNDALQLHIKVSGDTLPPQHHHKPYAQDGLYST